MTDSSNVQIMRAIAAFFEQMTGQNLSESRMWRVETALRDVMRQHGLKDLSDLLYALQADHSDQIAAATIHCITNHESSFFRDLKVFEMVEKQLLPHLNATLPEKLLRIWCVGCSTGQEVYSLAIILKRQEELWKNWRVSVIGTDISPFSITKAQEGLYQQMDVQRGLPIADLLRWFEPVQDRWRIAPDLRAITSFRVDNILEPRAVSGKFDLILCRNVLLYFTPELRGRALTSIARHARTDTQLVLGAGETTIGANTLFSPSSEFRGAYQQAVTPVSQVMDRLAS
ncbi:MAG TPA: protein-glutamate O-methyltransferase CheR [Sphingobium sp.]|uniref:CheR family methyltransferase n=1 Tax=Sphingobium sp. TaxID=1912891 RepID=UPI002ED67D65